MAELAARTSMSRAAFSRRFTALVGEPPMSYLTCWRLCLASDLLRDTDHTLAAVARQVGYANAYALSAAFTRFYGVRPGEFRTQMPPEATWPLIMKQKTWPGSNLNGFTGSMASSVDARPAAAARPAG